MRSVMACAAWRDAPSGRCSSQMRSPMMPTARPPRNAISTTIVATSFVLVLRDGGGFAGGTGSVIDTVELSCHGNLDRIRRDARIRRLLLMLLRPREADRHAQY